jgi:hypothetical protein
VHLFSMNAVEDRLPPEAVGLHMEMSSFLVGIYGNVPQAWSCR